MRVATSTAYSQGVTSINTQNYNLNKTMLQLSTGKRIVVPSDDPAGASRVIGLNQAKARTEQFQDNINTLKSLLMQTTSGNDSKNWGQLIYCLNFGNYQKKKDANADSRLTNIQLNLVIKLLQMPSTHI